MLPYRAGVEYEFWAKLLRTGEAAYGPTMITQLESKIPIAWGSLTTEPGVGMMEIVGKDEDSIEGAVDNILAIVEVIETAGYQVSGAMKSPFQNGEEITHPKPRYEAIWAATLQEVLALGRTKEDWYKLKLSKERAAAQVHFSFKGLEISTKHVHPDVVFLMNFLERYGSCIARMICDELGIVNTGHPGIWDGWAADERFSRFTTWYCDFDDLKAQFEAVLRLIKYLEGSADDDKKEKGRYVPDLIKYQCWANLEDHSVWWHFARACLRHGTIEGRNLPSMPKQLLRVALIAYARVILRVMDIAPYCRGFANASELEASERWRKFVSYPIIGSRRLPLQYTQEMWNQHVFH